MRAAIEPTAAKSLLSLLQECRRNRDLRHAKRLHAYMRLHLLESHELLGNHLVRMLAECGDLPSAQLVFDRLPGRNVYSWTSIISAYTQTGNPQHALHLYHRMKEDRLLPNNYIFVALLKACTVLDDPQRNRVLHTDIVIHGLDSDLFIGNTLVVMYGKMGCHAEAQHVFDKLCIRDSVSWNALIAGYAECGLVEATLRCLELMQMESMCPGDVALASSLKACGSRGAIKKGHELVAQITRRGLEKDIFIGSTIVDMYAKCGLLEEAQEVCVKLPIQGAISWNALISGYVECGLAEQALSCFKMMHLQGVPPDDRTYPCCLKACSIVRLVEPGLEIHSDIVKRGLEVGPFIGSTMVDLYGKCGLLAEARYVLEKLPARDMVTWNALIAGYAEHGLVGETVHCLEQMQIEHLSPGAVTYTCSLKACSMVGSIEIGHDVHVQIIKKGLEKEASVGNTLVDMYAKCGSLAEGQLIFDKSPTQDVISWNTLIKGYGEYHEGNMAIQCFEDMQKQGVNPNATTFTCLLAACTHASLVSKGQQYFEEMKEKYELQPTVDHYVCIVDLLARSGHVHEAMRFAEAMQCLPSEGSLRALITACRIHGDVELGLKCFQQLVFVSQETAAVYVLMADIYANAGMWSDAKRIEEMRLHAGAKKKPATASLQLKKENHNFDVSDKPTKDVAAMLGTLSLLSKYEGYVPFTDFVSIV